MITKLVFRLSYSLMLSMYLTSCASLAPRHYQLNLPPNPHLDFSGRGAAAGPMLMGAMGPAGIAVGLAIDIGIAKDIENNAVGKGMDIKALFSAAVTEVGKTSAISRKFFARSPTPVISLNKIGFIELAGQNDHVVAHIELMITRGTWTKTYRFPEDFKVEPPKVWPGATLEQLKGAQPPTQNLLQQALVVMLERGAQDWSGAAGK